MADGFKKREKDFEKKWVHDEELRFKVEARRNKLLGLWAAEEMGLPASRCTEYAMSVVQADVEEAGEEDVFRKIRRDFDAAKRDVSDHIIRRKMDELKAIAGEQIMAEAKPR